MINEKDVKTVITVYCEGEVRGRVVADSWWAKFSIDEIADATAEAVEGIE